MCSKDIYLKQSFLLKEQIANFMIILFKNTVIINYVLLINKYRKFKRTIVKLIKYYRLYKKMFDNISTTYKLKWKTVNNFTGHVHRKGRK